MEHGFVKGTSDNLPKIDFLMLDMYYMSNNFCSVELKHSKTKWSTREAYGNNAVGWVQIKRENNICTVKAKVTPEHKIKKKNYNVMVIVNEETEEITECKCLDCAASAGECKHAVAFLVWIHRKTEEPSTTSQTCYWKKSALSKAANEMKCMTLDELVDQTVPPLVPRQSDLLQKIGLVDSEGPLFDFAKKNKYDNLSVYQLLISFKQNCKDSTIDASAFVDFLSFNMSDEDCKEAEKLTKNQGKSSLWYEFRFGRITASKLYEAAKCKTLNGSLMETILGASPPLESNAVRRGLVLESQVIREVEKLKNIKINKCGLLLNKHFPIFGASPDGLSTEYCIEVKCPSKQKTVSNYVANGKIRLKFQYQMQLQMLFANKKKALFCVASPSFEKSKEVDIYEVNIDEDDCVTIIEQATEFWHHAIFPKLIFDL